MQQHSVHLYPFCEYLFMYDLLCILIMEIYHPIVSTIKMFIDGVDVFFLYHLFVRLLAKGGLDSGSEV